MGDRDKFKFVSYILFVNSNILNIQDILKLILRLTAKIMNIKASFHLTIALNICITEAGRGFHKLFQRLSV